MSIVFRRTAGLMLAIAGALGVSGQTASITFFSERQPMRTGWKAATYEMRTTDEIKTWSSPKYSWRIFVDGNDIAQLHKDRFFTVAVAPGRHEIRTARSESIIVDLTPGEHTFVRPGTYFDSMYKPKRAKETIARLTCPEVIQTALKDAVPEPIKQRDLRQSGVIIPESSFPSDCSCLK